MQGTITAPVRQVRPSTVGEGQSRHGPIRPGLQGRCSACQNPCMHAMEARGAAASAGCTPAPPRPAASAAADCRRTGSHAAAGRRPGSARTRARATAHHPRASRGRRWAAAPALARLANEPNESALHGRVGEQVDHELREEHAHQHAGPGAPSHEAEVGVCAPGQLGRDAAALGSVRVQHPGRRAAFGHSRQLPAQVERVLRAAFKNLNRVH
jgi:hypothetical protein